MYRALALWIDNAHARNLGALNRAFTLRTCCVVGCGLSTYSCNREDDLTIRALILREREMSAATTTLQIHGYLQSKKKKARDGRLLPSSPALSTLVVTCYPSRCWYTRHTNSKSETFPPTSRPTGAGRHAIHLTSPAGIPWPVVLRCQFVRPFSERPSSRT